ncbi:MAG: universal stress protein [Deltaproteobacteria bacterium]|nr:universal stress protein [Deltaproteobacteria bacterium]
MKVQKILWPTDLSGNAEKALPLVTGLSQQFQSEVHLLYVIEELAIHEPWYGVFDASHIEKIHEWERQKAEERLNWICNEYLESCPLYIKHIAIGDPADEILKLIREEGIDMVVMAKRGRKGTFAFGSVTEKVVKNAPVPVSVVPTEESA